MAQIPLENDSRHILDQVHFQDSPQNLTTLEMPAVASISAASERNARELNAMMEKAVGQVPLLVQPLVGWRQRALQFGRVVGSSPPLWGLPEEEGLCLSEPSPPIAAGAGSSC